MQRDRSDNPDNPPVYVARPRPYRARRAMWGIGALAMSPDAVPEGPRRRRLVRAATLTSAMGLAWASTASGAPPSGNAPSFDHIGLPSVDADEESMRLSSPIPGSWQQMHDEPSSEQEMVAPPSDAASAPPGGQDRKARKREQASEVTAKRDARSAEDQGEAKGAGVDRVRARTAAKGQKDEKKTAADAGRKKAAADKGGEKKGEKAAVVRSGEKEGTTGRATAARAAQDGKKKATPVRTAQQADDVNPAPDPDAWRTNVVASHEGVEIFQMSDETVLVGFHEAALPGAKPLTLASTPDANHGRGTVPSESGDDPLRTMILPTRARTTGAASAMDVVIPAREAVFAPVTGTVTELDHYQLYGRHPDNRMVIVPDARPDLRVVILHIEGLKVDVGDKVTAGQTRIAVGANPFTFESQIDRFAGPLMKQKGDPTPHVHIELR